MLKNVESFYFTEKLFSYIDEKKKLKLIRFNKKFQQNLNININHYIHFKENYIIYDSNGKGKEYDNNGELIFEGEYIHGEKNGKGKEYDSEGNIIFEGEYLNAKRNGEGKEYDKDGKFEGEYLNGKRHGKIKFYYDNGKLEFEGTLMNKILIGTLYDKNVNIKFQSFEENGKIKEHDIYNDKLKFEGKYLNNKKIEKERI